MNVAKNNFVSDSLSNTIISLWAKVLATEMLSVVFRAKTLPGFLSGRASIVQPLLSRKRDLSFKCKSKCYNAAKTVSNHLASR